MNKPNMIGRFIMSETVYGLNRNGAKSNVVALSLDGGTRGALARALAPVTIGSSR